MSTERRDRRVFGGPKTRLAVDVDEGAAHGQSPLAEVDVGPAQREELASS
jgi:hypothetical protein